MPKKDQFIIAYLADLDNTQAVTDYATLLARFLKKGIILLYIADKRYSRLTKEQAETRIADIEAQMSAPDVSHCILSSPTRQVVNLLPTMLNGVVAVAAVNTKAPLSSPTHPRQVMHNFKECKIAYLTVQEAPASDFSFSDIALRIDYRKESKEKLIWSSYFARFFHSRIHVLHELYSDTGLRYKFENNLLFLRKFYENLVIKHEEHTIASAANFPDVKAVEFSSNARYNLLICITTDLREHDFLDWIIGAQEHHVVRNKQRLPILFLNSRDDLYVLCD